jgi:hypothetical protein
MMCLQGNHKGPALVLRNLTLFENNDSSGKNFYFKCKMGSLYTFWEARLLSMIQHLIGKNTGVESACLLIYMVVLQIQMSKWHESAHGLVRKPGHLVCCIILFTNVLQIQL